MNTLSTSPLVLTVLVVLFGLGCGDDHAPPSTHGIPDAPTAPDGSSDIDAPFVMSDAPSETDTTVVVDGVGDGVPVNDGGDAAVDRTTMTMVGPYPPGPYGRDEGQTLANLTWEGYTNLDGAEVSTARPFAPTSMQAVRETGRAYAMVHLSEFF
jgi:hypothetical protein